MHKNGTVVMTFTDNAWGGSCYGIGETPIPCTLGHRYTPPPPRSGDASKLYCVQQYHVYRDCAPNKEVKRNSLKDGAIEWQE